MLALTSLDDTSSFLIFENVMPHAAGKFQVLMGRK